MKPLTAHTKKTIAAGAASVAVVAALGIGAVFAHGTNTKPNTEPTQTPPVLTQAKEETKRELSAQDVADATTSLAYAGDDVSASDNVSVSVKDGHVMVKETSLDTAANNVWYAPRRAAALAKRLDNTCVKADSEETPTDIKDITWVVTDKDDNVQIAVVDTSDSKAATDAGEQAPLPKAEDTKETDDSTSKPADDKSDATDGAGTTDTTNTTDNSASSASENANTTGNATSETPAENTPAPETEKPKTSDVLNGSDGYTMNTETHDGLPDEEKDKVGESGGKTVCDPDGNTIEPSKPAPAPAEEAKPDVPAAPAVPEAPSASIDSPAPSNNNGGSSAETPSAPAPREKRAVYRTETRYVVDKPAWSEQVLDHGEYVFSDGYVCRTSAEAAAYLDDHDVSYSVRDVYRTVYHPEEGHTEEYQVLDHYE
ncbi:hypothetical protein [Lancefieldella rimae]|uniref:hypothetical protein n=1 Tax=Lancefieldella rimae TaxID=1383 RepID=UPI0028EF2355|nr:hypothetical protein [Lancefieldella rimae]